MFAFSKIREAKKSASEDAPLKLLSRFLLMSCFVTYTHSYN